MRELPSGEGPEQLWSLVREQAGRAPAFGVIGLEGASLHLATARDARRVREAMPAGLSPASRELDVLVLNETILHPLLGIDAAALTGGVVDFTEEVETAWEQVRDGDYVAFLVNPVRVDQIVAVADADDVLPQKSTFFYPKLATGMVLNPLD